MVLSVPERLREVSAKLFGNRYRAEVLLALAVSDSRGVCLGDLAVSRSVASNVYQAPVQALVDAGLAVRVPREPGERRQWYRRSDDVELWRCLADLLGRLAEEAGAERVG